MQDKVVGLRFWLWNFLFYVTFGVVVTSFVRMGGVLLVFSCLIIPAVCANLLVTSFSARRAVGSWCVRSGEIGRNA